MTAKNTTGTSAASARCNYDAGIQDKAGSLASTSAEAPRHTPGTHGTPDNNMPLTVFYAASIGQWQIWKGGVPIGTANTEANALLIAQSAAEKGQL